MIVGKPARGPYAGAGRADRSRPGLREDESNHAAGSRIPRGADPDVEAAPLLRAAGRLRPGPALPRLVELPEPAGDGRCAGGDGLDLGRGFVRALHVPVV